MLADAECQLECNVESCGYDGGACTGKMREWLYGAQVESLYGSPATAAGLLSWVCDEAGAGMMPSPTPNSSAKGGCPPSAELELQQNLAAVACSAKRNADSGADVFGHRQNVIEGKTTWEASRGLLDSYIDEIKAIDLDERFEHLEQAVHEDIRQFALGITEHFDQQAESANASMAEMRDVQGCRERGGSK